MKINHYVPLDVVEKYWKSFQVPMLYEGFDEVILHNIPIGYNKLDEELYEKMDNFHQNSSSHTHTLGTHSKKVLENIKKLTTDETLINGAYLHDVGKLYVGELRPNGWTRYIGHAETGAYLKLQYVSNLEEVWYENFHMLLMQNLSDKKIEYYRNLFGERLWNNLNILRRADTLAH